MLCGVLHVAYQSRYGVLGRYMLCALFSSCLILGVPSENGRCYTIVASIGLGDLHIETTDNGKGKELSFLTVILLRSNRAPVSHCTVFLENRVRI